MIKNIKLQEICKELHIPTVGVTSWPLPAEARQILFESTPCPFTAADVNERLQGTADFVPKSAIVCLFPYYVPYTGPTNLSRYTWSTDYHLVVNSYLERLVQVLKNKFPAINQNAHTLSTHNATNLHDLSTPQEQADRGPLFSIHCDTSPLADRYMAYLAGLGFYGKNRCFISPIWGSYVVIGTVLTTLEFEPNAPSKDTCKGCNRCITACLGDCLRGDDFAFHTCKSYLTQKKGDLSYEEINIIRKSPLVFGCDVCQDVCPHNQHIPTTPIPEFLHIEPYIDIDTLETMTNREFKEIYGHRAFSWRGKKILIRNNSYTKHLHIIPIEM